MLKTDKQAISSACHEKTAALPDGSAVPRLGQGTWHMAEQADKRQQEIEALRLGISLGMTLIDTAEMYSDGAAESLVGEAIRNIARENLFLVSKVLPQNAGRARIFKSCEDSLRRLGVDTLDLYLLHWRGDVPLSETVCCMEELVSLGKIRRWGVSNFDTADMQALWKISGGERCAANQVLYHLASRGIEYDLLPWQRAHNVPVMAYCPLAQAGAIRRGLLEHPAVGAVASAHGATAAQVLLAYILLHRDFIAIPKAGSAAHALQNAQSSLIELTPDDRAALERAFPAPVKKTPLDME